MRYYTHPTDNHKGMLTVGVQAKPSFTMKEWYILSYIKDNNIFLEKKSLKITSQSGLK